MPAVTASGPPVTGCAALAFDPTIAFVPETSASDSPTGLHVDLHFPQEDKLSGLATANLKNAVVTLPQGMTVNPSSADGLKGCSAAQIGLQPAPDQVQTLAIERPLAHTFTLEFEGHATTVLPAEASAAEVQTALEALPGLGAGQVSVSAVSGGWVVEFTGARTGRESPLIGGSVSENAVQRVVAIGTGGSFNLSLGADSTEAKATGDLLGPGTGSGELSEHSPTITGVKVSSGAFEVGQSISGAGIPGGTTITAVEPEAETLTMSAPAEKTGSDVALTAGSDAITDLSTTTDFLVGEAVSGVGIPAGSVITAIKSGVVILSADATAGGTGVALSASLPYNASDALVREALEDLPGIGAGNVAVSGGFEEDIVSGARDPYTVTFVDHLAGKEVEEMTATSALTGSGAGVHITSQPASAQPLAVATTQQAGGAPHFSPEAPTCPNASKIGNVEVITPLLEKPLPGSVYLAQPFENPFGSAEHPGGSLLALYIVVNDPERGIVVKLAGHAEVGGEPGGGAGLTEGQFRATFENNPQLPVEDVKFHSELPLAHNEGLFGGTRAPLTTPPTCGRYTTSSVLTPWSAPASGPPATPSSSFEVTEGAGGSACVTTVAEEPNDPGFTAGTFTPIAGAYSPFVLNLSREDGSQPLTALSVTLPPGLTGKLAGIEQCPQADIEQAERRSGEGEGKLEQEHPSCPSASEVGTATVGAGSGAPYYVKDGIDPATGEPNSFSGRAYLAGPYNGSAPCAIGSAECAPFSVVVVTPAVAGPFDLGTVVVRSGLYINPDTAQVTAKSGPIPTSLDGIPLDVRSIAIELTRSQFTLNPTSCEKMPVTGIAFGESSQAAISAPFQVGGCTGLQFKPTFTVSTQGQTSKADGASLTVKVTENPGEANIHKVDLQLPIQLPSRLTTLQKACTAAQFEANPAGCPEGSDIGMATALTPLLSVPLAGPAYLVSHGGAAFPDVEFVLQGDGVEIVLDGGTDIKNGITYSKFETVPDEPISSFETVLPQGPHSALGTDLPASAKYRLCGQNMTIPTTITGQNGSVFKQETKIEVEGCSKTLRLVSKKLGPAGKTLTLSVEVPAAGKLTASGRGLKSTSKTATARQIVSLSVSLAKADAAKIAKHKSVKVKVNLTFAPSSGKKLTTSFAATYKAKAAKKSKSSKKKG